MQFDPKNPPSKDSSFEEEPIVMKKNKSSEKVIFLDDDKSIGKQEKEVKSSDKIVQPQKKPIPTHNQVVVKIPAPPLEKIKEFAKKFADAANLYDNFESEINSATNHQQIDKIIKKIIGERRENFEKNGMSKEHAQEWAEGMDDIIERTYGRLEKFGLKALDKAFGEKGDLKKLFESETAKETVEKIQKNLEKPLDNIEWATLGISLALMILEGGSLISQGSLIKTLGKEVAEMEKSLDKMPYGKARLDLENAIKSLKEQLANDKSELLGDVISFVLGNGKTLASITKKSLGDLAKAIAPKLASALGSKSIAFPIVGTALLAVQKGYETYRSIATQYGFKKFHEASIKGEATYDMSEKGTKELFLKQKIEEEDKKFLEKFAGDHQQLVDTNPYKSATIIYEALKEQGISLNSEEIAKTLPLQFYKPEIFDFLKAKAVLDEIDKAGPKKKLALEKEHKSLLKNHDKVIGNKNIQYKLLEGMKEVLKLIKKDEKSGVGQLIESIESHETEARKKLNFATTPTELYNALATPELRVQGQKGYSLKPSQLISEGTFRKTYYLTGPTVFGGRLLKMKITKEMHMFLKYQALQNQDPQIKAELDKLQKEYDKMMADPVKKQEVFDDFRALLQNKSARSAFIYNKVEGQFSDAITRNVNVIKEDFKENISQIFDTTSDVVKEHLNTAEKIYDHLVNGSYLKDKETLNSIYKVRQLTPREMALKEIALSNPIDIDPSRLTMEKGKMYFSLEDQQKIELNPALYWFLKFRGDKNQVDAKMGYKVDDSRLIRMLKEFLIDPNSELTNNADIIIKDSALGKIRSDLTTKDLVGQESILSKRANSENSKIDNAQKTLEGIIDDVKLTPEQKLQKLNSSGFKLDGLLHYHNGNWVLQGMKVEDDKGKQEVENLQQEVPSTTKYTSGEGVNISSELAQLISPQKFAEQSSLQKMKKIDNKNITKNSILQELNLAKTKIPQIDPKLKEQRLKKLDNAIKSLESLDYNDSAEDLNFLLKLEDHKQYENYKPEKYANDPAERRNFLLGAALNGSLDKFLGNKDQTIQKAMEKRANIYNTFVQGLQAIEEEKILNNPPKIDVSELEKILSNKEIQTGLAVRKGKNIDTRNTLFRQMAKVVKSEKLRQERVYNCHKARANFVGALGAVAGTTIATLVIAGVIATSASIVGLAAVGFAVLMTAVGLMILKAKKPEVFKAVMRAVPFRIAFNNMKKAWNASKQKKIEEKSKGEVALISVNATPKGEIDKFLKWVELNDNKLPSWKELSVPMRKMIAGLDNISVARLEKDWDQYSKDNKLVTNLIEGIKAHRNPEKARMVAKSPIDDLILEINDWKTKGFPEWKDLSVEKRGILAKVFGEDKKIETVKKGWEIYVSSMDSKKKNAELVIDMPSHKKSELQKKYSSYNTYVARVERQEQRIIDLKTRNDTAAGNDFALKLGKRMGQKKGDIDFNPGEMAWEELVAGQGVEDNELANLLKYEMGLDVEKMLKSKEGLDRDVMKDDFLRAFNGYLALEGQAFLKKMENLEKKIQSDFSNPLDIVFEYEEKKVI